MESSGPKPQQKGPSMDMLLEVEQLLRQSSVETDTRSLLLLCDGISRCIEEIVFGRIFGCSLS